MKRLLKLMLSGVIALVGVLVVNTLLYTPAPLNELPRASFEVEEDRIVRNMAKAVTFRTISTQFDKDWSPEPFENFIGWMGRTYPGLHASTELTRIANHTLLYEWKGSDDSQRPVLLAAHYDVVPVIPGTERLWQHPPYAGTVADGYIWGRGTLDDKGAVIAMAEAAEALIAQGFRPARTIYFAFGHDEEIGGRHGAGGIVELFKEQGIQLEWSLDEGSFLLDGFFPGVGGPVASINVAEKGYMTVDIVATAQGGHSSMPPQQTAVGILAEAIVKLEENPMPGGLDGLAGEMFDVIGPYLPFVQRMMFANQWLFGPVIEDALSAASPATNAMLRTTTAPTMLSGSIKENVLPIEAVGTVNFRIHPRDTAEDVTNHVSRTVQHPAIEVRPHERVTPASGVSSTTADGFTAMADTVARVFGPTVTVPGLTIGGTDSKHFSKVADNAYRFNPMIVDRNELAGFHGTNERLSVENMVMATRFYAQLISDVAAE